MTTPINSFQDILDALEQNPALRDQLRSHILTQELLQLPAQFLLLRTDVNEIIVRMDRFEVRMDHVEGRLGNIEGGQYEERAARTAIQLASFELGIQGPSPAFSKFDTAHPDFNRRLLTAVQSGLISQEDFRDLIRADLIIYGQNQQHAVVEISLGPNGDDISRALRRSQILQRATGEQVTAVVATPDPHPEFVQDAVARNVQVLDIPA